MCDFRRKEAPSFIQEILDSTIWTNTKHIRLLCHKSTSQNYSTMQCKYHQDPDSPTTLYTPPHTHSDKESGHMKGEHEGKFYKFPGQHCDRLWNSRSLQYNKWVYRESFIHITIYHSQFSLQNLQQRFGTHGAITPLTHTSLIVHRFLSHVRHTDSRGALSATLFQIRWVLGSLPLPNTTFSGFFSVSPNYVDMTFKEAMINATYWHHLTYFFF